MAATDDIRNLFMCEGSSLVTSERGQPTMTLQGLTFRAGELIANFAWRNEVLLLIFVVRARRVQRVIR